MSPISPRTKWQLTPLGISILTVLTSIATACTIYFNYRLQQDQYSREASVQALKSIAQVNEFLVNHPTAPQCIRLLHRMDETQFRTLFDTDRNSSIDYNEQLKNFVDTCLSGYENFYSYDDNSKQGKINLQGIEKIKDEGFGLLNQFELVMSVGFYNLGDICIIMEQYGKSIKKDYDNEIIKINSNLNRNNKGGYPNLRKLINEQEPSC